MTLISNTSLQDELEKKKTMKSSIIIIIEKYIFIIDMENILFSEYDEDEESSN